MYSLHININIIDTHCISEAVFESTRFLPKFCTLCILNIIFYQILIVSFRKIQCFFPLFFYQPNVSFRRTPSFLKKLQVVFANKRCPYARKCPIQMLNSFLFVWVLPGLCLVLERQVLPVFFARYGFVLVNFHQLCFIKCHISLLNRSL